MEAPMEAQYDNEEIDELGETVHELETRHPGIRADMDRMMVVLRATTALWQRREALGLSVEQVAERSGLSLEEVEAVEDNDVDSPYQRLARYAEAVGLQFELQQVPA
jgi:helix-turn-helix protein